MLVVILQRILPNVTRGRTTKWRLASGALVIHLRYLPRPTGGRCEVLRIREEAQEHRHRDICEHEGDGVTENDVCDGFVDQEKEVDEANEEEEH